MANSRILAGGGLVWRDASRRAILLVHRPRYDDWSLPKGKLDPDEGFVAGALREVLEETGCRARIDSWAGETFYRVGERSKSVLFWNMLPIGDFEPRTQDPGEVAEVSFVAIDDALRMMSYPDERALVLGNSAGSVT
ncbi:MAG: NUDIX hydrolase [Planctomycetota bacterium]